MRGIVTSDERQMIREKTGWECCQKCDSPIACAKDCCCARHGDEGTPDELSALADKYEAGLAKMLASGYAEYGHDAPHNHRLVISALRQKAAFDEARDALENSQSLLAMILHLGTEIDEGEQIMPYLWEGEGLTKLLTEQIVENRKCLSGNAANG